VFELLKSKFMDLSHEEFYVVFLDRANQLLHYEQLSIGGMSGTLADGKIIFRKALESKCSGIILAHNHPSGCLKPSEADLKLTKSLMSFGKYIDLHVLDHLIFSDNSYLSFADEGILN
jgi:DNA repair protein RadC